MTPKRKAFLRPTAATLARLYRATFRLLGRQTDEQTEPAKVQADLCLALAARPVPGAADSALPEAMLRAFSAEPLTAGNVHFIGRQ